MIIQSKYKLVKTLERVVEARYSDTLGLTSIPISRLCFKFEPGDYESVGEADEMRSLKDYPNDYIIIQVW